MAPISLSSISRSFNSDISHTSNALREQWITPTDIFSVLLILGGDVIARALAQLAGSGFAPVTFSFGWVSYSVSALLSAMGEGKLMPLNPDCRCKVINGKNGYSRENTSWILGRLVRDYEFWMHSDVSKKTNEILESQIEKLELRAKPRIAGLVVSIYRPDEEIEPKTGKKDLIYWSGIGSIILQLCIAIIPFCLYGDWGVFFVTTAGFCLAMATSFLPQWKREKWACREKAKYPYILTRGNGTQHAIVLLGNGLLQDLASGQTNITVNATLFTCIALAILSALWIILLISATGLTENTWYLLAIGVLGILQNMLAASALRRPSNMGVPLEFVEVFGETKVIDTLFAVEKKYRRIGQSLWHEFFGQLRPNELKEWEEIEMLHAQSNKILKQ
ncbi:hypothetical protein F5Y02DRAFT_428424 [Annulohypoxylon stygium]|nr:hypothetical protein F5Y02DRAFT_428424 [Annulohypoxylon stygium]